MKNPPVRVEFDKINTTTILGKPGWVSLVKDFTISVYFESGHKSTETVFVPFEWDGSSVPWAFRLIVPRYLYTLEASCVHDLKCREAKQLKSKEVREYGDILYKLCLEHKAGLNWVQRSAGYMGVRIGALWARIKGDFR